MYIPIDRVWYHFWSSALAGVLVLALIHLISSRLSSPDRDGYINWIYLRRLRLALLFSVWTHIFADIFEHGYFPRIIAGLTGAVQTFSGML
jgi:hypothetical protein